MKMMRVQSFLSCSFEAIDQEVVRYFAAIARALDVHCENVDKGSAATPADTARELISDCHVLIGIATRRDEIKPGVFTMPKAVAEEVSMAYAMNKPILLFVEKGVDTSTGFTRNFGTYQEFDRTALWTAPVLEKILASLHSFKVDVISLQDLAIEQQGQKHVYAEQMRYLVELIDHGGTFTWRYSETRRLKFSGRFPDPIITEVWPSVPSVQPTQAKLMVWKVNVLGGSKPFTFSPTVETLTPDRCVLSIAISPIPEADDFLCYSTIFESPYMNPIFRDDMAETNAYVTIDGQKYSCHDGLLPIVRAKDLLIQWRFPPSYGLLPEAFAPLVGSCTNRIDYLVESEIKRAVITKENFGGNVVIDLSIQSPLLQHVYGIAWNPPTRPAALPDR